MSASPEILQRLKECKFEEAIPLVEKRLREAAAQSPADLLDAARGIAAWRGFFRNIRETKASEPYFRAVHRLLEELSGPESPAAMAAAENLAGILGSLDQSDEAIALREKVFAHASGRFATDDPRLMQIRDGLVFLYRRSGQEAKAAKLYRNIGLCEHLSGALGYILDQGARVVSCGQPWSDNCHVWVYFDALLDCESLLGGLKLDPCVHIHDHRGTHEGSERGLVCTAHWDAVMGPHPSDASAGTKTISAKRS